MDTYPTHEESLEPVVQTFLDVAKRRAMRAASHSSSSNPRDYNFVAQQLKSLENCLVEFKAKMQHQLSIHRRAVNALLPIHRMPSEIFIEIFILALYSEEDINTYQGYLKTFRCVSAAWRELIDNSASLWATVSCVDPLGTTRNALVKSKDSLLHVTEFLALVIQHVHRWRAFDVLDLTYSEGNDLLDRIVGLHAPRLQELSLVNTSEVEGTQYLFNGQTHQLRRIKLDRSRFVPWNSILLSNLHVLHLRELGKKGPSANQVESILRASPALVELTLEEFSPVGGDAPSIKRAHAIELLSLKIFTMGNLTPGLTTHILNGVPVPNCENIIIRMKTSAKASYSLDESFLCSVRAIAEASDSAEVKLGEGLSDLMCGKESKVVLDVCINGKDWEFNIAESLLRQLNPSLDLGVMIDTNLSEKSDLTKILDLFSGLQGARALRLTHDQRELVQQDGSSGLVRKLGVATRVDGILRWPLPLLETLRVESPSLEGGVLIRVIRARLKAKVEPPSKLKPLELVRNLESYFSTLESTLGEGVVSWIGAAHER
ncbi:hypothetical protein FRB98_008078 [Tulasnella sp. 332]|nr:hypothetical protein FRB98_008078 [Tulasnella sp. 332]